MKTAGIIAEYNPFHNGHKYQIEKIKENLNADNVVCIMSGNFTQRGELSIIDKYKKAEMAVKNGANLVIELPFVYACTTAEIFASSSVRILNSLGIINYLCFGMEDNSKLRETIQIAKILLKESDVFKEILKDNLSKGKSYIESKQEALNKLLNKDISFIKQPNNILALEYIKELISLNSLIIPYPIKRTSSYKSTDSLDSFLSAYGIREKILKGEDISDYVPINAIKTYNNIPHVKTLEDYFFTLKSIIMSMDKDDLYNYSDVEIGLNNRIYNNIFHSNDVESFINLISTKRYTKNRIRRILIHILTNYQKKEFDKYKHHTPGYIKVLAFDNKGRTLLKEIKQNGIQIFNNLNKDIYKLNETDREIIEKNIKADNIYNINLDKFNLDFYKQAFYLDR